VGGHVRREVTQCDLQAAVCGGYQGGVYSGESHVWARSATSMSDSSCLGVGWRGWSGAGSGSGCGGGVHDPVSGEGSCVRGCVCGRGCGCVDGGGGVGVGVGVRGYGGGGGGGGVWVSKWVWVWVWVCGCVGEWVSGRVLVRTRLK